MCCFFTTRYASNAGCMYMPALHPTPGAPALAHTSGLKAKGLSGGVTSVQPYSYLRLRAVSTCPCPELMPKRTPSLPLFCLLAISVVRC